MLTDYIDSAERLQGPSRTAYLGAFVGTLHGQHPKQEHPARLFIRRHADSLDGVKAAGSTILRA
jgi:hypothetical protein